MDGHNNGRPVFTAVNPQSNGAAHPEGGKEHKARARSGDSQMRGSRIWMSILLIGVAVIVIGVLYLLAFGNKNESSYVNKNDFQAVFVNVTGSNGGQAYFGHVTNITPQYITLDNVFYLESTQSSTQFTLNNLACTVYGPDDQMIINRQQVDFWENLASTSQVTKEINQYTSQKLTCSSTSSTSNSSSNSTNNSSTSNSSTSNSSNTTGSNSTTSSSSSSGSGTSKNTTLPVNP